MGQSPTYGTGDASAKYLDNSLRAAYHASKIRDAGSAYSPLRRGATGGPWEGDFPRYVWYKLDNVVYEGRLVNRGLGDYKGYKLNENEWPENIEAFYGGT